MSTFKLFDKHFIKSILGEGWEMGVIVYYFYVTN